MTVPKHDVRGVFPQHKTKFQDRVIRSVDNNDEKLLLKQMMLDHFYTEAPVPIAIGLRDSLDKHDYLNQELGKQSHYTKMLIEIVANTDRIFRFNG